VSYCRTIKIKLSVLV